MIEFYSGTSDSAIERLCHTIEDFDKSWRHKCLPASEEQIKRLKHICNRHGYSIPSIYISYLQVMGSNDGGLLEREWDGSMECDIKSILELFDDKDFDAIDDLKRGLMLFSYHWTDTNCYLRISEREDNPVVTDRENQYFAGSFEKYLFQKAFDIYQGRFDHKLSIGPSIKICDTILKKHSFPCSLCGGSEDERMKFTKWLVKTLGLHEAETWFSDKIHYFSYSDKFALKVNLYSGMLIVFSCKSQELHDKIEAALTDIVDTHKSPS